MYQIFCCHWICRHRLEEEAQYHAQQEVEKNALESKVKRLTRLILTSTRALTRVAPTDGLMLQRSRSVEVSITVNVMKSCRVQAFCVQFFLLDGA